MSTPTLYEQIVAQRGNVKRSRLISQFEANTFDLILECLERIHRPPTEEETDASLTRIGDADTVAMITAAAAVRYVKLREQWGVRSLDDRDFADQLDAAYHEMKDATERFEEAMV